MPIDHHRFIDGKTPFPHEILGSEWVKFGQVGRRLLHAHLGSVEFHDQPFLPTFLNGIKRAGVLRRCVKTKLDESQNPGRFVSAQGGLRSRKPGQKRRKAEDGFCLRRFMVADHGNLDQSGQVDSNRFEAGATRRSSKAAPSRRFRTRNGP